MKMPIFPQDKAMILDALTDGGGGGSRASAYVLFSATYRFHEVNNVPKSR
jgi:hypothetical protein